ncbi:MAG: hypothetical protein LAP85_14225 [Acidobacteriia bacterium]|nr:hypothetical protein [Terriglobia bacterium]
MSKIFTEGRFKGNKLKDVYCQRHVVHAGNIIRGSSLEVSELITILPVAPSRLDRILLGGPDYFMIKQVLFYQIFIMLIFYHQTSGLANQACELLYVVGLRGFRCWCEHQHLQRSLSLHRRSPRQLSSYPDVSEKPLTAVEQEALAGHVPASVSFCRIMG